MDKAQCLWRHWRSELWKLSSLPPSEVRIDLDTHTNTLASTYRELNTTQRPVYSPCSIIMDYSQSKPDLPQYCTWTKLPGLVIFWIFVKESIIITQQEMPAIIILSIDDRHQNEHWLFFCSNLVRLWQELNSDLWQPKAKSVERWHGQLLNEKCSIYSKSQILESCVVSDLVYLTWCPSPVKHLFTE